METGVFNVLNPVKCIWILIILGFTKCIPGTAVDTPIESVFNVFPTCHIRIISSENELVPGTINQIISILQDRSNTYSNYIDDSFSVSPNLNIYKSRSPFNGLKFTETLVHLYMEDDLTFGGQEYIDLKYYVMHKLRKIESPHHFLFFGNFGSYGEAEALGRLEFYRDLHDTFAKGIILSINHNKNMTKFSFQLICIICKETLKQINLNAVVPPKLLQQLPLTMHSRSIRRQVQIEEYPNVESSANSNCDFGNPKFRPAFPDKYPLICLYHVLLSSYNITFGSSTDYMEGSDIFMKAHGYSTIYQETFEANLRWDRSVVPFPFRTFTLRYVAFQPTPTFSIEELAKPFDWQSWVAALIKMTMLACLFTIQSFPTCGGFFEAIFFLSRISLNQPYEHRGRYNIKCSIYTTWLLGMLVLSEAYKGMILSFLTKPSGAVWPTDLQQLILDKSYALISLETEENLNSADILVYSPF